MSVNRIYGDTNGGNSGPGYIDDFRYYNTILDQTQVTELYEMYSPWTVSPNTNRLILYYPFNKDLLNYATGTGVSFGSKTGSNIDLSASNYVIGTGSLYKKLADTSSYFSVNSLTSNTGGYTFALWVYFTNINTAGTLFSFANANNSATRIFFSNTGSNLSITCNNNSISNLTAPTQNTWTHYTWTLDVNSNSKFYINGVLQSGFPSQTIPYASFSMNTNYIWGDTSGGSSGPGYIDDFRYYNTILNQTQVTELYNMKTDISNTVSLILRLYYPFDTDISNYATGTGVTDGTIVGSTVTLNNTNYAVGTGSLYQSASNTTSYFLIPTITTNTKGFSFSFWVYFNSVNDGMIFTFAAGTDITNNRIFVSLISNTIRIGFVAADTGTNVDTLITPNLNTWYHYAWTLDKTSKNRFYVNGDISYSSSNNPEYLPSIPLITNRILGSNTTAAAAAPRNGARAYIDDFRYYDGILSPTQVTDLYNSKQPYSLTLKLYYPFDTDISNYASGTGVTNGAISGSGVTLNNTNYAVGTGSLKNEFNSTSYFEISSIPINTAGYSFSFWMKLNANSKLYAIFSFYNDAVRVEKRLLLWANKTGSINMFSSTSPNGNYTSNFTPTLNVWHHIVWTIQTDNRVRFYADGIQTTTTKPTNFYQTFTSSSSIEFFQDLDGNIDEMAGYIDDFRYYDGILSQDQITELYNSKNPYSLTLKLYYPFDTDISNYASGRGVTFGNIVGPTNVLLNYTNPIVGLGCLHQKISNTSSYFNIPAIDANLYGYSFSFWFYFTNLTTNGMIFSFTDTDTAANRIYFFNNGNNTGYLPANHLRFNCNGKSNHIGDSLYPKLNTWYHYVWTLDTNSNNCIYINGVLQVNNAITPTYASFTPSDNSILGDKPYLNNKGQQGYIDDFRYYDGILIQDQVTDLYNKKGLFELKDLINTLSLILYYPFNTDIKNYASGTGVTLGTISGDTIALSNTNYAVGTGSLYHSVWDSSSCFNVTSSSALPKNKNGYSFSFWFYLLSKNNLSAFFSLGVDNGQNRITMYFEPDNNPPNTIRVYSGGTPTYSTGINPDLNTWYHIVWTLDKSNKTYIYLNGINTNYTADLINYLETDINDINDFYILGDTLTNFIRSAHAYVDDFRYYDGILSPTQVTDLYNLKKPQNFNPNTDYALCIYYPFDISRNYVVNYAASVYGVIDASYVNGAVVDYTTNKVGTGALILVSASSQYVQLNSNSIAQTTNFISPNGMSFSLWIKSNSTSSNTVIFYFGSANAADYIDIFINSNSISCKVYNTNSLNSTVSLSPVYNNNIWRHVVWTLGYSSSNTSRWNIYIDGIMLSDTSNNYYPISTTAKTISRLGSDGGSFYYNGWIDDFRVYQRVLNQLEVTQLYNYQDTSANFPTLNANTANFSWSPPARNGGVSYNYYYTDNSLNTTNTILSDNRYTSGLQWKAFYGVINNFTSIASSITANSFQTQSRYSGGENSLSSTSSNVLLTDISYNNNIAATGNRFGFSNTNGNGDNGYFISLVITGYFLPNQTGTWNFQFGASGYSNDDFSVFWINDINGTTNHWPPTDNNYNNITMNTSTWVYTTALTAGIYYPMQLTWSQAGGGSVLGFAYKGPGMGSYSYDGSGVFFYYVSAPIITNTKATNALIPEINIDNSNSYYVNSQRGNKQSVYANITI
jgi:hypothetical protein